MLLYRVEVLSSLRLYNTESYIYAMFSLSIHQSIEIWVSVSLEFLIKFQ
jgi:hypothetical protein